ncbi:hypothetical protein [Infirmifilum uzonense]|nr:hypothetical protein [Infirmifilum uzonense]
MPLGLLMSIIIAILAVMIAAKLGPPNPPAPQVTTTSPPVTGLSEDEKKAALSVVFQHPLLAKILSGNNWSLVEAGSWTQNGELVGAALLIRLNEPVWVEGSFSDFDGKSYRAALWIGSLHVLVDLRGRKVEAISPGMTIPPQYSEPLLPGLEKARQVVANRVPTAQSIVFNGVFYTDKYPTGLAFFYVKDMKGEYFIAVNLATMSVEDKYTAPVIKR